MSDHAWVQENLFAYHTGGLEVEERSQLESHLAECGDCSRQLDEIRGWDGKLTSIFAEVQPPSALEDQLLQKLRPQMARRKPWRIGVVLKVAVATAAVFLLAVLGAGLSAELEPAKPGQPRAENALRQIGLVLFDKDSSMVEYEGLAVREEAETTKKLKDANTLAQELSEETRMKLDRLTETSTPPFSTTYLNRAPKGENGVVLNDDLNRLGGKRNDTTNSRGYTNTPEPNTYSPPISENRTGVTIDKTIANNGGNGTVGSFFGYTDPSKFFKDATTTGNLKNNGDNDDQKKLGGEKGDAKGGKSGEQKIPEKLKDQDSAIKELQKTSPSAPAGRKIIRSGNIEFEVESFDKAVEIVQTLVASTKGYVDTINSEKLPNGKVRGSVVVRVPPEQLDKLVLDLRKELGKTGELMGQRIGSEDITKKYTDLESRLKASRTMEERLLKIIKDGQGPIKDLLQAEKELGVWRTKIEELEGELRYYGNLVALSTLTITLTEKSITTAAKLLENERVQAGIEVDDVEKGMRDLRKAVDEAKGRITRSEMKQYGAGQFNAILHFEVDPEKAGPVRDRMRQLGNVVRLEINTVQSTEGGTKAPDSSKVKHGDTQFQVSLYNLANIAPREIVTLKVASSDVPSAFAKLRETVGKAKGRVTVAQLNEKDRQNITAQLEFSVRRDEDGAIRNNLSEVGEILSRSVSRQAEGENVTDAKILFKLDLVQAGNIAPRETITLAVEVQDVDATLAVATTRVKEAEGRVVSSQIDQQRTGQVTARLVLDVPFAAASGVVEKMKSSGIVRVQQVNRNPQAPEGKLAVARIDLTISNMQLVPQDETLFSQVRHGLSISLRGLSVSVSWLIVAVLFLLPWALVLWLISLAVRRIWRHRPVG